MIDAEVYLNLLIKQAITAAYDADKFDPDLFESAPWVSPDIDVDTLDNVPAITWNILADSETANGPGLWNFVLNVNLFGYGMDQAKALMLVFHAIAEAWENDTTATVIDVDGDDVWLSGCDVDRDIPTRLPAAIIDGRMLVQYSGGYGIGVRSNA